jgi:hypothetical protein
VVKLALIDGCPVPASIAPYIHLVLRKAGQNASSIYRGEDAKTLLHRHGKHTQAEIHRMYPAISNPPGRSQHELRSDGVGNPGPVGRKLAEWQVGVDSGTNDQTARKRIEKAAGAYGWRVVHPYSRGVEGHHWCFAKRPRPKGPKQFAQIVKLRAQLVKAAKA